MSDSKQLFDRCAASCHQASSLFSGVEVMISRADKIPVANLTVLRNLLTESLAGVMKLESLALGNEAPKDG